MPFYAFECDCGHKAEVFFQMDDDCCVYCGDEANTVDHVIPISKGGTDDPENLVAACSRCNFSKGDAVKIIKWLR